MRLSLRLLSFVLAGNLLLGALALAQTTGATVSGTVTDPQGAAVPNAQVVLTNIATNVPFNTTTNGVGIYQITGLLPGIYKATVTHEGFNSTVKDGIVLHVLDQISLDFSLQVGSVAQSVTVEGGAALIETASSTIGQVIESRGIVEQPLNGRNIYSLLALVPGVVANGGTDQPAATSQIWANNNFQIGGGFGNESSTYVDGGPINVSYAWGSALTPTQDAIEEFKVETNNIGPQFGNTGGGIVNMVTRSGSNAFHGTAYEFLRNRVLNANTFYGNEEGLSVPAFTQNNYGAALGGPIVKDKTFFYFSWESFALRQGNTFATTIPTVPERSGDFSAAGLNPIYDPCAGNVNAQNTCVSTPAQRTQFQNNMIPSTRLDPTAMATILTVYPLPNATGVSNFINNYSSGVNSKQFNFRVDESISSKQKMFGRYTYEDGVYAGVLPYHTPYTGTGPEPTTAQQFVLGDNYAFSPTTLAQIRISYLRFTWAIVPPVPSLDVTKFDWPAAFNTEMSWPYLPGLCIAGYDNPSFMCGNSEQNLHAFNNNYSISGSFTKVNGRHTFTFGGEAERLDDNYGQSNSSSGVYDFSSGFTALNPLSPGNTGNALASAELGYGASGSASQLNIPAADYYYQGYFVNDQYKVTSKLTLNLGLRWEQPGTFTERHNRATVFLPNAMSPLASLTNLPLTGNLALVDTPEWTSRHNMAEHWDLFAPRVGFAYRLGDKTALRAGFGVFFPPTGYNLLLAPGQSPVNSSTTTWITSLDGGVTPYATLHNPYPNGIIEPAGHNPDFETALYGNSENSPIPIQPPTRIFQYNFSVERQLGGGAVLDVTYAGGRGTNLPILTQNVDTLPDADLAQGSTLIQSVANPFYGLAAAGATLGSEQTVTNAQLQLPYPQFTGIGAINRQDRNSYYNSLQVKIEKRFSHGGTVLAAYTWSKLVANTDELPSWSEGEAGLEGPQGDQDPHNLQGEMSLSGEDVPQNLVISYVVDLPFGKGHRWLPGATGITDKLVGGWAFDGTTTLEKGFPLGISNAVPAPYGGSRPNVVPGCNKVISGSAVSRLNGWFNTACFSEPPAFSFGGESREDPILRAEGVNNWNVAIAKRLFTVHDRVDLAFRAEFFNLFNRVMFGPPGTAYGTPQFGVIGSTVNNPRLVQLALRLSF